MAEKLVDLEDSFRQCRFRHLTTVERIIGFKRGTSGAGTARLSPILPKAWTTL
jgi:tryptophan 2,3-dioxygenase